MFLTPLRARANRAPVMADKRSPRWNRGFVVTAPPIVVVLVVSVVKMCGLHAFAVPLYAACVLCSLSGHACLSGSVVGL